MALTLPLPQLAFAVQISPSCSLDVKYNSKHVWSWIQHISIRKRELMMQIPTKKTSASESYHKSLSIIRMPQWFEYPTIICFLTIKTNFRGIFELTPHSIFENSQKSNWSSSNRTFDLISASSFMAIRSVIQEKETSMLNDVVEVLISLCVLSYLMYRRFLIRSRDSLSLVIPNNKTID